MIGTRECGARRRFCFVLTPHHRRIPITPVPLKTSPDGSCSGGKTASWWLTAPAPMERLWSVELERPPWLVVRHRSLFCHYRPSPSSARAIYDSAMCFLDAVAISANLHYSGGVVFNECMIMVLSRRRKNRNNQISNKFNGHLMTALVAHKLRNRRQLR